MKLSERMKELRDSASPTEAPTVRAWAAEAATALDAAEKALEAFESTQPCEPWLSVSKALALLRKE